MHYYWIDNAYVVSHVRLAGRTEIPPRPRHDVPMIFDNGAWRESKKGRLTSDIFFGTVFQPPAGYTGDVEDYVWSRKSVVIAADPAVQEFFQDGKLATSVTRLKAMKLAGWWLTHDKNRNDLATRDEQGNITAIAPGGILTQEEYARIEPLLIEYEVA